MQIVYFFSFLDLKALFFLFKYLLKVKLLLICIRMISYVWFFKRETRNIYLLICSNYQSIFLKYPGLSYQENENYHLQNKIN